MQGLRRRFCGLHQAFLPRKAPSTFAVYRRTLNEIPVVSRAVGPAVMGWSGALRTLVSSVSSLVEHRLQEPESSETLPSKPVSDPASQTCLRPWVLILIISSIAFNGLSILLVVTSDW